MSDVKQAIERLKKDVKMMEKAEPMVHYYKKDKDRLAFDIQCLIDYALKQTAGEEGDV